VSLTTGFSVGAFCLAGVARYSTHMWDAAQLVGAHFMMD
jgi:hypothetical protein